MEKEIEEIKKKLKKHGQEHLWDFYEALEGKDQERFFEHIIIR